MKDVEVTIVGDVLILSIDTGEIGFEVQRLFSNEGQIPEVAKILYTELQNKISQHKTRISRNDRLVEIAKKALNDL